MYLPVTRSRTVQTSVLVARSEATLQIIGTLKIELVLRERSERGVQILPVRVMTITARRMRAFLVSERQFQGQPQNSRARASAISKASVEAGAGAVRLRFWLKAMVIGLLMKLVYSGLLAYVKGL